MLSASLNKIFPSWQNLTPEIGMSVKLYQVSLCAISYAKKNKIKKSKHMGNLNIKFQFLRYCKQNECYHKIVFTGFEPYFKWCAEMTKKLIYLFFNCIYVCVRILVIVYSHSMN